MPKFTLQHATKIALLKLFIILGMHLCIRMLEYSKVFLSSLVELRNTTFDTP